MKTRNYFIKTLQFFRYETFASYHIITLLILFAICSLATDVSENGKIKGHVSDSVSGEALYGINIFVYSSGDFKAGAATDISGNFELTIPAGNYEVKAVGLNYEAFTKKEVVVGSGGICQLDIVLVKVSGLTDLPTTNDSTTEVLNLMLIDDKDEVGSSSKESESSLYFMDGAAGKRSDSEKSRSFSRKGEGLLGMKSKASSSAYAEPSSAYGTSTATGGDVYSDYSYTITEEAEIAEPGVAGSDAAVAVGAGILTAGEVNDFTKWNMWQDIAKEQLKEHQEHWEITLNERYTAQLKTAQGNPIVDCVVQLKDSKGRVIWSAKTDNTGKAELWDNVFKGGEKASGKLIIEASLDGKTYQSKDVTKFHDGINVIEIPVDCNIPDQLDVLFVVDATGSMGDEINYLKEELNDVIGKVKTSHSELNMNMGSIFYRDFGDEYVIKTREFSTKTDLTIDFIKEQYAGGGGDFPEAVDTALYVAINSMKWSKNARARLLFLLLDAPPHHNPEILKSLQKLSKVAAEKGIRIIPVSGSGIDKSTEYLMRSLALATNGTYTFLTDHSGVGGPHIEPTTDEYDVEKFNDLLIRLFNQFTSVPPCSDKEFIEEVKDEIQDTMSVNVPDTTQYDADTNVIADLTDTNNVIENDTMQWNNQEDSITDVVNPDESLVNWKYYPNPTSGQLFIEIDGDIGELYLADVTGKLLEKYTINDERKLELDISRYPSGIYYLQYYHSPKDKWLTGKVVLVHNW